MGTAVDVTSDSAANAKVNHALFASQANLLNESHLCFNKAQFSRTDFNVERFVNLARRRANLQQIHNDLRVYLKIVQNSMIELINDDYADFVNLSSNLVGLKETIDKLTKDIETIWHDFCSSTQNVMQSAEFVERKAADLIACRQAQCDIRAQIFLIKSIERLVEKIASKPEEMEPFWLQCFADTFVEMVLWSNRASKVDDKVAEAYVECLLHVRRLAERWLVENLKTDCRFIGQILGIIVLNNNVDSAVSRVMTEVIDEKIGKPKNNLGDFLDEIYETIRKLREDWLQKLAKNDIPTTNISPFLDKCLLTFIISALDQHFSSVIVPIDNRLFHRCYKTTCNFISNWPDAASSRTVLRMIRDKFSLVVYFKLETQHFLSELTERLDPSVVKMITDEKTEEWEEKIFCEYSKLVVDSLERVWSDEVYLPTLIDKSWDFSLKILSKYLEWIEGIKNYYWTDKKAPADFEVWRLLCAICSDCTTVDGRTFGIALSSIWPKIREHELDVTMFGQCLSVFSTVISERKKEFEKFIIDDAVATLTKNVDGVSGIPRQYRWTKKPAPVETSPYVGETSATLDSFKDEMGRCCWAKDDITNVSKEILTESLKIFCSKAEQVLESVEQTETSLQRFKRKSVATNESNADSDESKIRRQLTLDLEYFKTLAMSYDIEISHIDTLISRANPSTESVKIPGSIHSVPNMADVAEEGEE